LIAWAQAGHHGAFEALFTQYQAAIQNYVYRLMGTAEDAHDLTQDTFLKAYLNLPKTTPDLRVGAWLYRIATNACLDELRHRKLVKWQPWDAFISVFHPTQIAKDNPVKDVIDREDAVEVQLILDRLHPKYRICLLLREFHDLSYDEIADALLTTRAAVKSLLFRAREEFRQVYARTERKPGRRAVDDAPAARRPLPDWRRLAGRRQALGISPQDLAARTRYAPWQVGEAERGIAPAGVVRDVDRALTQLERFGQRLGGAN
jgi:RNA polymerase sigma-70 factor (ECF subfamily)